MAESSFPVFEQALHRRLDVAQREGFFDVDVGPVFQPPDLRVHGVDHREQDERDVAQHFVVADLHQQVETVHFGHQGVADDQVARLFFEDGEGFGAVFRRKDAVGVLEILDQKLSQVGSVLHDHDVEGLRLRLPVFRAIGWFGGVYPPPSQTWRLGLLIGSPAHFVEEVHRLDRKFHAALVAYGLAHGVEVADRDARYVGAGAHLVDEVLRRGELIQLDQRLGPLQDDVGVADEREVRVAALPVDQFALEETHVLAVAVVGRGALVEPEVAAAGSLQVERPAELLADHVLVAVESRREAVHRFVGGDDRLLEPRVALVVGGLDPGLVAVVEVVAVEDVLSADADRLGLLRRQFRVAFQPVAAEEHGPLSRRQLVPVLKPGHLAPFEFRAVVGKPLQQHAGDVLGLVEVTFVAAQAEHHRVAVERPGLSPRPGGFVAEALHGLLPADAAVGGVVVHQVIAREVGPEMVAEGRVGVRHRDTLQGVVPEEQARVVEVFEVHHVVDDHRVFPVAALAHEVPAADDARHGREPSGEDPRRGVDGFEVFLLAGDPVGVAETAVHLESQVVVRAFLFEGIEFEGVFFGQFAECLVAGILIYIPERAGIESAAPPADVGRDEFSVGGRRSRKRLVGQPAFELFVLGRGYGEDAIGQFRHCLPGSASREKEGRQQCCAIGSGSHVRQ